ncbi:23S rRNA (guanosine2251-2'-O)-methyltransferase [Parelusimicrobium proximum]|uniref:23S rRNA (guanosine(2251)-2'-O)-methyltransferase RlmB n=1 Tax=Parelusimicrobium proximum TaxID=3228953 RepID=UPI003D174660
MSDKLEVIYGLHSVAEVLRNKKRHAEQLYVLDSKGGHKKVEDIIRLAKSRHVKIDRMDAKIMDALTKGANHQGVILKATPLQIMKLSNVLFEGELNKKDLWIAVDGITDPQNLGSIIRSAVCLGFSTLILPKRRNVGLTPAVYRVASGAVERIRIVEVANLNTTLIDLKEEGFWIYGSDMKGKSIKKVSYNMPAVLVVGSEEEGVSPKTLEHCDEIVSIPQAGELDSLNAANAASIIMYDMYSKGVLK